MSAPASATARPAAPAPSNPLGRAIGRLGRALDHPAVLPGVLVAFAVFVGALTWMAAQGAPTLGYDAHAYYEAAALDDPYRATIEGGFDAAGGLYEYKYPPPLAQVLAPIRMLGIPWPAFFAAWTIVLLFALLRIGRRWTLLLLFFPPVLGELWLGNVNLLIAVAIVAGFRWPGTWSFVVLTKLTTGIGLLWFAVRREWRQLGIALAATAIVAGVSYVLAPGLWSDFWLASQTQTDATLNVPRQAVPLSLPVRLVAAAVIVAWGGLTDRRWTVPVAVSLAVPFLWWNVLAITIAAIPLWGSGRFGRWVEGVDGRPIDRAPEPESSAPEPESSAPEPTSPSAPEPSSPSAPEPTRAPEPRP